MSHRPLATVRLLIIKRESVESNFVYPLEGSDKTQAKINDAIPHTKIDMRDTWDVSTEQYLYQG